jgi:L-cystine uptake protein TcyP (sodium:dicarboxylate symporter family)
MPVLPLDFKLGYALLRDGRVPMRCKFLALAAGFIFGVILEVLEIPLETILAAVPFLGLATDLVVDGAEMIVLPVLFASILLPFLAPGTIVRQVRAERAS